MPLNTFFNIFSTQKQISNAWEAYISKVPFTHFLTLSFNERHHEDGSLLASWPLSSRQAYLIERTKLFIEHLEFKLYRRQQKLGKSLIHLGFFEQTTRKGNPCHFHAHLMILVGQSWVERFDNIWQYQWHKLNCHNGVEYETHIETIASVKRVAKYITKKECFDSSCCFEIIGRINSI